MAASERNPYKRGWYWRRVCGMNRRRFISLDESAVNTAMTPTHGRAPVGERVVDSAARNYAEQTSIVGAPSFGRGLVATTTLTGAVDTLAFDAYPARVLAPRLRRQLENIVFSKGERLARRGLLIRPKQRLRSDLAERLGCELNDAGLIKTGDFNETTV